MSDPRQLSTGVPQGPLLFSWSSVRLWWFYISHGLYISVNANMVMDPILIPFYLVNHKFFNESVIAFLCGLERAVRVFSIFSFPGAGTRFLGSCQAMG